MKPVKEIVYVFMKGQGWIPTVVREDVRDLHVRLAAKPANFDYTPIWDDNDDFYYTWIPRTTR